MKRYTAETAVETVKKICDGENNQRVQLWLWFEGGQMSKTAYTQAKRMMARTTRKS